jgi:hypothetical protein
MAVWSAKMSRKGRERKWPWPALYYRLKSCLDILGNTENFQDNRSENRTWDLRNAKQIDLLMGLKLTQLLWLFVTVKKLEQIKPKL